MLSHRLWLKKLQKVLLCLALLSQFAGCAYYQKKLRQDHVSSFLSSHSISRLKKVEDQEVMKWIDPVLSTGFYKHIIVQSVEINQSDYIDEAFSRKLNQALTNRLEKEMMMVGLQIRKRPIRRTLILRSHVSAVDSKTKGIGLRDLTISSAIFSSIQAILGHRDSLAFLYLEMELLDAKTETPLAAFVCKGSAIQLDNDQITISDMLKIISFWIDQGVLEIEEMKNPNLRSESVSNPRNVLLSSLKIKHTFMN